MEDPDPDAAIAASGWSVRIPPLFSSPEPIRITANNVCQSSKRNIFFHGISANAKASRNCAWRSAVIGLTGAERTAADSWTTNYYMLVGFACPGSDVDVAKVKPGPGDESHKPATEADLGLVVIDLGSAWEDDSFQTYLLADMMDDGLCTPYKFDHQLVFYLPGFRVNDAPEESRWEQWEWEVGKRARALLAESIEASSGEESPSESSVGEASEEVVHSDLDDEDHEMPLAMRDEESPIEDESLFFGSREVIMEETSGEEEEEEEEKEENIVELARAQLERGEVQSSSQSNFDDADAGSPAPAASFTDQLSQMTADFETIQEIQNIDQTIRLHLTRIQQEELAMRKFVDFGQEWEGSRDSHNFCVEITGCCQLKKMPRMNDVTSIRNALVALKADLGYDSLGQFFKFVTVLLTDEKESPIPQDTVSYAVLKTLELMEA
ncbi:hypothetical protein PG987_006158 [Apiospora arundinis]